MFVNIDCSFFGVVITLILLLIIRILTPAISRRRSKKNLEELRAIEEKRKLEIFKYIGEREGRQNTGKGA